MDLMPADFHFLRPLWLSAAVPAGLLFLLLRRRQANNSVWTRVVDRSLLSHLLDGNTDRRWNPALAVLLIGWLLAVLGLAGPTWEKLPQPVRKKTDALVIIQDLSLSMYATDLRPNRLTRAGRKLLDLLAKRREGTTALVVYAGDAHVVAPLTDDTGTISAMVPDLSPSIMPVYGSNLSDAVSLALELLKDGSEAGGRLLLITDEVEETESGKVNDLLAGRNIVLSVLGVGTGEGGPIPKGEGGFLSDERGNIIVPRLNRASLRNLAATNHGRYSDIGLDDADIDYLLGAALPKPGDDQYRLVDREFDQWRDRGYWLVLAILPLALPAFRRGWLLGLIMILLLPASEAKAMSWQDLWLRKDQQGVKALESNDPRRAAELFTEPQWQGVAEFRAGNYETAAEIFAGMKDGRGSYNRGNALARQGRLEEAVEAYDRALELDPELEDARYNKELLEKLIRRQKEQDQPDGDRQSSENQQKRQGDQDRQNQDQGQPGEHSQDQDDDQLDDQDSPSKTDAGKQGGEDDSAADSQADRSADSGAPSAKAEDEAGGRVGEDEERPPQADKAASLATEDRLNDEERQALEQWLRRIPDNPGGLLKRKFEYQYRQKRDRSPSNNRKIW
ncbi:MAG: VWA domain-containing protein [Desulfobulbales bacterium]|nr:VWA domain-containing protein [Desulfobulbales bacterium]